MNLFNLANEYLSPLCKEYNLKIFSINNNEVGLIGSGFLILIWLDSDGVAVKYVIVDDEHFSIIDLGPYLASKRSWHIAKNFECYSGYEKIVRQGLASYALTFRHEAIDILSGEKSWLNSVRHHPIKLSQESVNNINKAINDSQNNK